MLCFNLKIQFVTERVFFGMKSDFQNKIYWLLPIDRVQPDLIMRAGVNLRQKKRRLCQRIANDGDRAWVGWNRIACEQ